MHCTNLVFTLTKKGSMNPSLSMKETICETKSFALWLLRVVALLGLVALILWLSLRPSSPSYTIVGLSVPVSTNETDQAYQNGTFSYYLDVENPNDDCSIYHDDILLIFYYGQDTIGERTIPSFHQGKSGTSQFGETVDAKTKVWRALATSIANKTAEIKVALATKFRYRMWGRTGKHHGINLQGRIPIGPDGKISGKKKKIKLKHGSKKWRLRLGV